MNLTMTHNANFQCHDTGKKRKKGSEQFSRTGICWALEHVENSNLKGRSTEPVLQFVRFCTQIFEIFDQTYTFR